MTALMLPRARGSRETVIRAALAGLPAFAVVTVPKFATDFARFGPQGGKQPGRLINLRVERRG